MKIREQAKAYLEMKNELVSGVNLLNSTNLEYFPVQHKAEIFRLKGEFLQKTNDNDTANQMFSTAISLHKHLPKGWISWGNHCDKVRSDQFKLHSFPQYRLISSPVHAFLQSPCNQVYKETGEEIWLEYAVSCFLQGIKYGSSHGRSHLARVLYLLSFDNQNGTVGKAFDKYGEHLPHWFWLSWIPQLLLSLQRPEAQNCRAILLKLANVFPQVSASVHVYIVVALSFSWCG